MSLVTIFSAPKPFTDPRIALIQYNAIGSWTRLPDVDVILMGQEEGLDRVAKKHGVTHMRQVQRNPHGTPLVSSMLQSARDGSSSPLLCIINADMILMPDFVEAARQVIGIRPRFVLLSRRWDLDVQTAIDFSNGWDRRLLLEVREKGALHRPTGSDVFLFPRSCYTDVPSFTIGRAGWDNWMIYKARKEGWPVVDATSSITLVHQNHDYSHLPGGEPHYALPESEENVRLAGGSAAIRYTIVDASHTLRDGRLARPPFTTARLNRSIELFLRSALSFLPPNTIEELVRPRRWKKRIQRLLGNRENGRPSAS